MNRLGRLGWAWPLFSFLRELIFVYPVYAIMMGEQGISPFELSLLFVLWSLTVVILEVPSGTLGDVLPRRSLLVLSGLIKACCYPAWLLLPGFAGFLLGFVLWGVAGSLRSGTAESFLYDSLVEVGNSAQFERIYGRGRAAEQIGVAVAFLAGGVMAENGYTLPLILSMLGPVAASLVVFFFLAEPARSGGETAQEEPELAETSPFAGEYWRMLSQGLAELRHGRGLQAVVILTATAVTAGGVLDEYVGPILDGKDGLTLSAVGVVLASIAVAAALASALAHRLSIRSLSGVSWLLFLASLVLVSAAFVTGWPSAAALVVFFGLCSISAVLLDAQLQRSISGRARATVSSLSGFCQECFGIFLYLLIGSVAQRWDWQAALLALAMVQGVCSLAMALRTRSTAARSQTSGWLS